MNTKYFTTTILLDASPEQVFHAINNVRGWWSGVIDGNTDEAGAEFTYTVPGVHFSKQKITVFDPYNRIEWHVIEAMLGFVSNKQEWKDTSIRFDIDRQGNKTQIQFTHVGLEQANECYKDCSNAWQLLIAGNLKKLVATGEDQPSPW